MQSRSVEILEYSPSSIQEIKFRKSNREVILLDVEKIYHHSFGPWCV